jgi:hypothetical protein
MTAASGDTAPSDDTAASDDPVIRYHVVGPTAEDLRAFVDEVQPDVGCRPVVRRSGDGLGIDVYMPRSRLDAARGARTAGAVTIDAVEDVTSNWQSRRREVGRGDRFAARGAVPRGLGRKE